MKHEELNWLATELGLSVLDEAPLNAASSAAEDEWLVERLRSALGGRAQRAELARALISVRAGRPMVLRLAAASGGPTRALVSSGSGSRLLLWTDAPAAPVGDHTPRSTIEERAHVADAAAAMAHEVANATSAIAGWARLARTPGSGVSAEHALGLMGRAAEAANQAARRLLRLAQGDGSETLEPLDFSATTDDLVALLGTVAREANVRIGASVTPNLWVRGSVASLFTVVWNLAKNAIEASGARGQVQVSLTTEGDGVVLSVRDSGPGLSVEARERIFEKYVTTKATGTGLGLPLVQATVHALGGELRISSELGQGSVFSVRLPRHLRDADETSAEDAGPSFFPARAEPSRDSRPSGTDFSPAVPSASSTWSTAPGKSAFDNEPTATRRLVSDVSSSFAVANTLEQVTAMDSSRDASRDPANTRASATRTLKGAEELSADILIVEDDDPLREMMATVLRLRGARVTCARNIHEARNVSGRYDIALIDLALDECRGDELLASLRRRGIVSAAMLVTGSVQKPRIIAGGEPDDWVRKPFEISELVERIQRTLARHSMLESAVNQRAGA